MNEATARIKINTLLEAAGWRFFADADQPANIQLEPSVTLTASDLDALGDNFDTSGIWNAAIPTSSPPSRHPTR